MRVRIGILALAAGAASGAEPLDIATLRHARTIGDPSFRHAGSVTCIRALPDGRRILSAAQDGTVRLWDATTRREIRRFSVAGGVDVWDVVLRSGRAEILAATEGGDVIRWDLDSGRELARHKHPDTVFRIAEFPDGESFVATGSKGGALRWAWDGDEPVKAYSIPKGAVYAAAVAGGGRTLITGGSDEKGPCWWSAAGGDRLGFLSGLTGTVHTVALSPDGKAVAVCIERQLAVLDPASGAVTWSHTFAKEAYTCAWSPDGARLAVTTGGALGLFRADGGEAQATVSLTAGLAWACAWSPDGGTIHCGADNGIAVVDVAAGKRVFPPEGAPEAGEVRYFAASADGARVWAVEKGAMWPVHAADGTRGEAVALHDEDCAIAAVADGRYVIASERFGGSKPHAVFDAATGQKTAELAVDGGYVRTALAADATGSRVFAAVEDHVVREYAIPTFAAVRDWSVARPRERRRAAPDWIAMPDGNLMADVSFESDDLDSGAPDVRSLAVSPGGRHLAAGCSKGAVVVWDRTTGRRWPDLRLGDEDISTCIVTDGDAPVLAVAHGREMSALALGGTAGGPAEAGVRALIARLGADTHEAREAATRELAAMGEAVRPFLRKWTWDDPEIAERLRKVEAGLDGVMAGDAPAVAMQVPGEVQAMTALPNCDAWALVAGRGADAEVWFCALRGGEIRVLHRIRTGRGPAALQWLAGVRQLWIGNRDGTIDRFDLP